MLEYIMCLIFLPTLLLTFSAASWTFTQTDAYYYHVFGTGLTINVPEIAGSSMRILAIFAWKQTILTLWNEQKSTLISKSVTIQWL